MRREVLGLRKENAALKRRLEQAQTQSPFSPPDQRLIRDNEKLRAALASAEARLAARRDRAMR
jgi:hypothetical protein